MLQRDVSLGSSFVTTLTLMVWLGLGNKTTWSELLKHRDLALKYLFWLP